MRLKDRVVVITGGARGIGGAAAVTFAREGARVAIGDILAAEAEETMTAVANAGGEAIFVRTDVTNEADCAALMQAAVDRFGSIDVLLLSHGVLRGATQMADELDEATWDAVIDINLKGDYFCVRQALPFLRRAQEPVILLMASQAGVEVPSSSLAYGASKGGVHGFAMTLADQLRPFGIRVHDICPSAVATPMKIQNVIDRARAVGQPEAQALAEAQAVLVDPFDIASILAFLASREAACVRGTIYTR